MRNDTKSDAQKIADAINGRLREHPFDEPAVVEEGDDGEARLVMRQRVTPATHALDTPLRHH